MLEKSIAALKAAEAVIQEEYESVKGWNAQARGALEEVFGAITLNRTRLETIEPSAEAVAEPTETPDEEAAEPEVTPSA